MLVNRLGKNLSNPIDHSAFQLSTWYYVTFTTSVSHADIETYEVLNELVILAIKYFERLLKLVMKSSRFGPENGIIDIVPNLFPFLFSRR